MIKTLTIHLVRQSAVALIAAIILLNVPLPQPSQTAFGMDVPSNTHFFQNKGQIDEQVAFFGSIKEGTIYVENDGTLTYKLNSPENQYVFKEKFVNSQNIEPYGQNRLPAKFSSFIGENPITNIPAYSQVNLGEVYPDIQIHLQSDNGTLEKIFTIAPSADPTTIQIQIEGIQNISKTTNGELTLTPLDTPATFTFSKPVAWQLINNKKTDVSVEYNITGNDSYSFTVGNYNPSLPLIIDPLLGSTFLGGTGDELTSEINGGNRQMVIANNSLYVTGGTSSTDFPVTVGPYGVPSGENIFVTKFDLDLTTIQSSTVIGSSGSEYWSTITADGSGNIFIAAVHRPEVASNYPVTAGAFDETFNGLTSTSDVVVTKLSSNLDQILASTFVGGTKNDNVTSIAINSTGQVYISGVTAHANPSDFPITAGTLDTVTRTSGSDVYIAKLPNDLSATGFTATYFYSDPLDPAITIGPAPDEDIFIVGRTYNTESLSTTGTFQESHGGGIFDNFVARVSADLSTKEAFTYIGDSNYTNSIGVITKDGNDIIILADTQNATTFYDAIKPETNINTTTATIFCPGSVISGCSSTTLFVAKFNLELSSARFALIGGNDYSTAGAVATDSSGNIFTTTMTLATDYPTTTGAYMENDPDAAFGNDLDIGISKFSSDLTNLSSSTYFGALEGERYPYGIYIDSSENIYISGETSSADFTVTENAPQTTFGGMRDFFVSKFSNEISASAPDPIIDLSTISANQSVNLTWSEPEDNGSPINSYTVQYKLSSEPLTWTTCADTTCTDTTPGATVPNLTNWESYDFRVYSTNDTGTSAASNIVTDIPTPCGTLKNNDESVPGETTSQSCIGASVESGGLYFDTIPESFSFPQRFFSDNAIDSFSNDDPATRSVLDISTDPTDRLTIADLRNDSNGFAVTLTSTNLTDGANHIPLNGLYVATSCPQYFGPADPENDLPVELYSLPHCDNTTGVEFADGSIISGSMNMAAMVHSDAILGSDKNAIIQAFMTDGRSLDVNSDEIPETITIMSSIGSKVALLSQMLNFYLSIPASQEPGSYSILFTLDLISMQAS